MPSKFQNGIVDYSISDHLPNLLVFNHLFHCKFNEINKVNFRNFSVKVEQNFIDKINDSVWLFYNKTSSVNSNTDNLWKIYIMSIINVSQ